jgi:hypothetical protein
VIPKKQTCSVSYGGKEITKTHFEFLTGTGFTWVAAAHGQVPAGAISSGNAANGEPLYIGRAPLVRNLPGKIQKSHGCLYFPNNGVEQATRSYEVLVKK